jgi:MFS family permease
LVAAGGVVLLALFVAVERRAAEPVLPLPLLRDKVFAVASTLSLIVGFALFGSVTFLPLYFQTVDAATPTQAGLRLLPMMVGVLSMSILSGQLISRRGRYRAFPIVGTLVMATGLILLSRLDVGTSSVVADLYLLVLGIGLGLVMQVLVLVVQNAVDFKLLGAATSGVTLFRGMGGSIGAAVFGTIFSSRLASQLKGVLTGAMAHQVSGGGRLTGAQVAKLPPTTRMAYEHAYVHALRPVFVAAAGVAALGFLLSWMLPERTLREAIVTSRGLDDSLAAPRSSDSLAEIERALTRTVSPDTRARFRDRLAARAGVDLSPGATWALVRISEHGLARARTLAERDGVPEGRIAAVVDELRSRGLIATDGAESALTSDGRALAERAVSARRELLNEALGDETATRDPAVDELLHRLARELAGDPPEAVPAVA